MPTAESRTPRFKMSAARLLLSFGGCLALIVGSLAINVGGLTQSAGAASFATVTFAENANPDDSTASFQTAMGSVALTQFHNLSPSFSNPGYTFESWNSTDSGVGTTYSDGAIYNFALGDTILYAQWTENSITFRENRSGLDSLSQSEFGSGVVTLTQFQNFSPVFSDPGYSFAGWTTMPNGTGIAFANGSTFDLATGDLTLYAQWTPVASDTANFEASGGSGSVQPVSGSQGTEVTAPSGSGLTNPGYTFAGWNTSANGTGTEYLPGSTIELDGNVTFYAQWTPDVYTVTYSAGSGSVSPGSAQFTVGMTALSLPTPINSGYAFSGWYTASSGGTLVGLAGSPYMPASTLTLYARWAADTYTVTYDAGTGTVTPSFSQFTVGGTDVTLPSPANGASTFVGWFSAPTGGVLVGLAQASYAPAQSLTLYAQWVAPVMYTLTFDPNGATGTIAPITAASGSSVTVPGVSGLSRKGFTLTSWATSSSGGGTTYTSGSKITLTSSVTLFAQWSGHAPAVVLGAVGPFAGRSTALTATMRAQVSRFATSIKARAYTKVSVYGYSPSVGLASLSTSISRERANAVASCLRKRLAALHVTVVVKSAGEGFIAGAAATNARVELVAQ